MKTRSYNPCAQHHNNSSWASNWQDHGLSRISKYLKKDVLNIYRKLVNCFFAASTIGLLIFGGVYLFLSQLSKYGW